MKSQKQIFEESEADAYFDRNRQAYASGAAEDRVASLMADTGIHPGKLLEIGCSNGMRLENLRTTFGGECFGLDPSADAVRDGIARFPDLSLCTGTAEQLPFGDDSFDTIIFGFCLYLCDRKDLFKIACEADRCLRDCGNLVIKDFDPPFPYKNKYAHMEGVFAHKMDYSRMFSWNPAYVEISRIVHTHDGFKQRDSPDERVATTILRKLEGPAYPLEPFATHPEDHV